MFRWLSYQPSEHPTTFHTIIQRLAIKVKPAAERSIRQGHPWVFEGSIVKQSKEGQPGDLAIVFDNKKDKLLAVGLYDPLSPIRIKLLSFGNPVNLNRDWFLSKLRSAHTLRQPLLTTDTNSYRLVFGENDGLPALIADVYADVLVIKLYSPIWLPYWEIFYPLLLEVSKCKTLVLRLSRHMQEFLNSSHHSFTDGQVVHGELPGEEIAFKEHGVLFSANIVKGHKTGFFLDHRHNRRRVGALANGRSVLDVFSYAGGFSVHALVGGATSVTSLDVSAQALEMAKKNAALNGRFPNHLILAMDAFGAMEQLSHAKKTFDLVIVDPPSFAKKESEVERAIYSYTRLARLAIPLVAKKGILMLASCSSRINEASFFEAVERELKKSGREFRSIEKTFHDVDHPVTFPEGAYLKAGWYGMD